MSQDAAPPRRGKAYYVGVKRALFLAIATFVAGTVFAGQPEQDATLKGIAFVNVVSDILPDTVLQIGINDATVVNDVESALHKSSLRSSPESPTQLHVSINAVDIRNGAGSNRGVAFTVSVSVEQRATLQPSGLLTRATTWRRAAIGVSNRTGAKAAIRAQLAEYLQAFVIAWRTANPPPRP